MQHAFMQLVVVVVCSFSTSILIQQKEKSLTNHTLALSS